MAQSLSLKVKNTTGTTIVAGKVVILTGFNKTDGLSTIGLADYGSHSTLPAVGIVFDNIINNEEGLVRTSGLFLGFDTSHAEIGDEIWVGSNGDIVFSNPDNYGKISQLLGTVSTSERNGIILLVSPAINRTANEIEAIINHDNLVGFNQDEHFIESSIDHNSILNVGINNHTKIDDHIANLTIHSALSGGSQTAAEIEAIVSHDNLLDFLASEHFTEASIDHGSIAGLSDDDHTGYLLVSGARAMTGPLEATAGLVGAPSIHLGDTTTGLYSSTLDWLQIAIAGVEIGRFNSSGLRIGPGRSSLINTTATATKPNIVPTVGDSNTGIGRAATGQLSLIAGGVEVVRAIGSNGNMAMPTTGAKLIVGDSITTMPFDVVIPDEGKFGGHIYNGTYFQPKNNAAIVSGNTKVTLLAGGAGISQQIYWDDEPNRTTNLGSMGMGFDPDILATVDPFSISLDVTHRDGLGIWNTTATDEVNYELAAVGWNETNLFVIKTEAIGTGTQRDIQIIAPNIELNGVTEVLGTNRLILPSVNDSAAPTLAFGNGDTGFYEQADDQVVFAAAGIVAIKFLGNSNLQMNATNGANLIREPPSATNPVYVFALDIDTGIGTAAADQLSLIAGGVEGIRITETAGLIDVNIDGVVNLLESAAPSTTSGYGKLYSKTDGDLYYKDDAGTETNLVVGGLGGSGTTDKVAFFSATDSLTSDTNLHWDDTNKRLGIGEATPLAPVHITSATIGGSPVIDVNGDELVLEGSGNSGMTILSGVASTGRLNFGDVNDTNIGHVKYEHNNDRMIFHVGNSNKVWLNSTGMAIGGSSTLGVLTARSGSSGGTVNTDANELVLESDLNAGITILSGTASKGQIFFADSGSDNIGRLSYDHSLDEFTFSTNGTKTLTIDSTGNLELSGQFFQSLITTVVSAAAAATIDWDNGNVATLNLSGATGIVAMTLSNPEIGATYVLKVIQHAITPQTLTWPGTVKWQGGTVPVISTGASAVDTITFLWDGTNYYANIGQDYS